MASGTPIEGEAGVGYALKREYDLPPLMFDPDELEALALGGRIASSFGDEALGRAADSALSKIEAVLPPRLCARLAESPLYAPRTGAGRSSSYALAVARAALTERRRLRIQYCRKDFRTFRLDRMETIEAREPFEEEPGRTLRDYLRNIGPYAERLLDN